jgi:hypothetical protein
MLGVVAKVYNPGTWEAEEGGSQVWAPFVLHRKILSQKKSLKTFKGKTSWALLLCKCHITVRKDHPGSVIVPKMCSDHLGQNHQEVLFESRFFFFFFQCWESSLTHARQALTHLNHFVTPQLLKVQTLWILNQSFKTWCILIVQSKGLHHDMSIHADKVLG